MNSATFLAGTCSGTTMTCGSSEKLAIGANIFAGSTPAFT
jgi:hypothetical protein